MPSVEGRQRAKVIAALLGSGVAAGLVTGVVFAVALIPLRLGHDGWLGGAIVAVVAIGVGLDLLSLATGRLVPFSIGRQVPREWIEFFSPTTVAVLFGTRLGIGPATMLSTWTWWSVTFAAGLLGFAEAAVVGGVFGLVRSLVTIAGSYVIEARDAGAVMPKLRARRGPSWATINVVGLAATCAVLAGACGGSADPSASSDQTTATTTGTNASIGAGGEGPAAGGADSFGQGPAEADPTSNDLTAPDSTSNDLAGSPGGPPITNPVQLEDFVRTLPDTSAGDAGGHSAGVHGAGTDGEMQAVPLADDLPEAIDGFEVLAGPETDRFLDLRAAADLQPDPTEEVALLETRGYRGGWTRAFRNDANDVAVASVYEFEDAAQAEFYLEDGLITIGGYGGSFFDIEGLPGVRGFAQSFDDADEELLSLGAAFQAGPRWYLVYLVGSPETVSPDVLLPAVASRWQTTSAAVDIAAP